MAAAGDGDDQNAETHGQKRLRVSGIDESDPAVIKNIAKFAAVMRVALSDTEPDAKESSHHALRCTCCLCCLMPYYLSFVGVLTFATFFFASTLSCGAVCYLCLVCSLQFIVAAVFVVLSL